jgi:hypothetical protein
LSKIVKKLWKKVAKSCQKLPKAAKSCKKVAKVDKKLSKIGKNSETGRRRRRRRRRFVAPRPGTTLSHLVKKVDMCY